MPLIERSNCREWLSFLLHSLMVFLIVASVSLACRAAGHRGFITVNVTLGYTLILLYIILSPFFQKLQGRYQLRWIAIQFAFPILCFGVSFFSLHVSDAMILEQEFGDAAERYEYRSVEILPWGHGYLIHIVLKASPDELETLVRAKGLEKTEHPNFRGGEWTEEIGPLAYTRQSGVRCYANPDQDSSNWIQLLYDSEAQTTYYEKIFYGGEGS